MEANKMSAIHEALAKIGRELNAYCNGRTLLDRMTEDPPDYTCLRDSLLEIERIVAAAFSSPARNCDVKYADRVEMYGAFKDWCRARGHTMEPMLAYDAFEWLLSPADQEGDGDGRK